MRSKLCVLLITSIILILVGCGRNIGSEDNVQKGADDISIDSTPEVSEGQSADEEGLEDAGNAMPEGEVTMVGQVISVVGNMVKVQVGTNTKEFPVEAGGFQGKRPEGMTEGQRPDGMAEGEPPEGMDRGELPEGMTKGERAEGANAGAMKEQKGGMQGGMMGAGIEAVDMSEFIELTDEVVDITIPVGTPVYSKSVEYEFTDIVEECYIRILENEDGTIVAVSILG